jgi:hypothetical protein
MSGIITNSLTGIEVELRNSLNLFVNRRNFDILKNKMDKEARKGV